MKKFVYIIFALFLTIGCLDKTTENPITSCLNKIRRNNLIKRNDSLRGHDIPIIGGAYLDSIKEHNKYIADSIRKSQIDSIANTPLFPDFDDYTCWRPDYYVFLTNRGRIIKYKKFNECSAGVSTMPKNHLQCLTLYRDYNFDGNNDKNAIGRKGNFNKKTYSEWVKKISWYKIVRFRYIEMEEYITKNIIPKTFNDLATCSFAYNTFKILGFEEVKIINYKSLFKGHYTYSCRYLLKAPLGYECYIKACHTWFADTPFIMEPEYDLN